MAVDPALGLAWQTELITADAISQALAAANRQTSRMVVELGRIFAAGLAPNQRERAHRTIGEMAQQSTLRSYDQTVTRNKRPASRVAYRLEARNPRNRRFAGGALRRALAASDFVDAGPDHLAIININRLDREARHWARLNAGAGSIGRGSRRSFEVRWSNLTVAAIGLEMSPSQAFLIPRGYWFDAGEGNAVAPGGPIGAHQFHPIGEGPRGNARSRLRNGSRGATVPFQRARLTRGIRARNFLDAGVATVAKQLPPVYERMYDDLFRQGIARVRPGRARVHVATTRRY